MKRTFSVFTLLLVPLVCFALFSTSRGFTRKASAAEASELRAEGTATLVLIPYYAAFRQALATVKVGTLSATAQPTATLIFRGLIIFQPDSERRYFDVGILNAPEHELRIEVRENSPDGVSVSSVPLPSIRSKGLIWSLEFANSQGVTFYQSEPFDRNRDVGDEKDSRWLVDLEGAEFYHRQLPVKSDQLSLVLRMTGGEFYSKKRTLPLMRKEGDGKFHYFGRVTDELATDINLADGDLVLRSREGTEILRLKQKPSTTYEVVIENAFVGEHRMASSLNHFQYYYGVLEEPPTARYEFRAVNGSDFAKARFELAKYANGRIPKTDEIPCMPIILGGALNTYAPQSLGASACGTKQLRQRASYIPAPPTATRSSDSKVLCV
jgi:hypothetical protein